jgi:hypothetical protein
MLRKPFVRFFLRAFCLGLAIMVFRPLPSWARPTYNFTAWKVPFSVSCDGLVWNHRLQSVFVFPGEVLNIGVIDPEYRHDYTLQAAAGQVRDGREREWTWTLPAQPGVYRATVARTGSADAVQLQCFVLVPYARVVNGRLNGYEIGDYPPVAEPADMRQPPRGFIEVTPETAGTSVSAHFLLGQFLCPQSRAYPQYCALDARLLVKLEALLEALNNEGHACRALRVTSGFRTPAYNRRQRHALYSTHLWGQAADIYVDADGNGRMDDLNHDGRINDKDAQVICDIIDRLDGTLRYQDYIGGLGRYEQGRGAFVHVDVRGSLARWKVSKNGK